MYLVFTPSPYTGDQWYVALPEINLRMGERNHCVQHAHTVGLCVKLEFRCSKTVTPNSAKEVLSEWHRMKNGRLGRGGSQENQETFDVTII